MELGADHLAQRAMQPIGRPFQCQLLSGGGRRTGAGKAKDRAAQLVGVAVPEAQEDLLAVWGGLLERNVEQLDTLAQLFGVGLSADDHYLVPLRRGKHGVDPARQERLDAVGARRSWEVLAGGTRQALASE